MLFSASVIPFVFISCKGTYFLARPDAPKSHRWQGFSNCATAALFIVTIINFLLSSLSTRTEVAIYIVFIRKALILNINYLLSE